MRQIILDTETTGLHANAGDRIIEFAGLEMFSRRLTGRMCHFYIYPDCNINEEASRIHGITLADLEGKPRFAEVGQEIHEFLRDAELIIHNAPFDIGFLNMEFSKMGLAPIERITKGVIDTLVEAKKKYPGKRNSLDALCERLQIDKSKRVLHGALVDCDLLAQVYLAMTHNQFSLVMELSDDSHSGLVEKTDFNFSKQSFKVIRPSAEELDAHQHYLEELAKTCQTIYALSKKDEH